MSKEPDTGKDLLVYKLVEHRGVKVVLKVDYIEKTVSLMDYDRHRSPSFKNKQWVFAEREKEYMGGWIVVFECMEKATKLGYELLEARDKDKLNEIIEMHIALDKFKDNKSKKKLS